jgi:hypothetical protein
MMQDVSGSAEAGISTRNELGLFSKLVWKYPEKDVILHFNSCNITQSCIPSENQ